MGERARGVVLYACAGLILAGGGVWWVRAAPRSILDPRIAQWQQSAERMLPDTDNQQTAGTVALAAGVEQEVLADGGDGPLVVSVVCVGGAGSAMRISLSEAGDSGRGLDCAGDQAPFQFKVTAPDQLRMNVTVTETGPVVFRYALVPAAD